MGAEDLETYLGVKKYRMDENEKSPKVGVVNGLAYTGVGGARLYDRRLLVDRDYGGLYPADGGQGVLRFGTE